eukprot:11178997-Lingulodinium_polyedra.AAC.1
MSTKTWRNSGVAASKARGSVSTRLKIPRRTSAQSNSMRAHKRARDVADANGRVVGVSDNP